METATLDDLMAMNEQLAALIAAGVPIDVGLDTGNAPKALEKINATVARRVSRGVSLEESLESGDRSIPTAYGHMMQMGIHSGQLAAALPASTRLAESVDDSRNTVRLALFYPILICFLAYLGLIVLCQHFVPTLEGFAGSVQTQPGRSLAILHSLRETLPDWAPVPPVLLLLWLVWRLVSRWRARTKSQAVPTISWLPGMSKAIFDERAANFAALVSKLLNEGTPFEESLRLAAGACGDRRLQEAAETLADGLNHGQPPGEESPAALTFPPFLRWALWHSESTVGRPTALALAAEIYQKSATHRFERLRLVLPAVTCVIIGGGVTLLYGMALFAPVAEMLLSLAK